MGLPLHQLTPDQLREVNQRSRTLRAQPAALAKAIREEAETKVKAKKSSAPSGPKVDVKKMAGGYL
jgi:hypothetical protein